MPELPDVETYCEALRARVVGDPLTGTRLTSPFVLRTVEPPLAALHGRTVERVWRLGKRIVLSFAGDHHLVIHLMIAGRLQWSDTDGKPFKRPALAHLTFPRGTLYLTEAGTKRRASLSVAAGPDALRPYDRGGLEPLAASFDAFAERVRSERHTIKRTLTDPRLLSGIGNAYSDEILHRAHLSPMARADTMDDATMTRLYDATRAVLVEWVERFRRELGGAWPTTVTAFRPEMAVHGQYGKPCPVCGSPVQRIRYADNETNYCARCQTEGRLLADRGLSRLLKDDWPRSLEELDA
ncbi:MAG: formamidopyrimidine-DNA glycosylase [Gemmatimonadaceae bacterium]|jgi:formamidopyrimidine-DNA glycosylase|nr:formamidopyrimidine-DNA glycosylase [Gemmatimonadaceae bacterium]